ncbi:MAG: prolipoprotein diacylglyceryl transferase [Phycisphaerae bacterium]|nr:prolipoprotein diacylglyceryl transferase [Phycisphaerae bacterium]
MRQVIVDLLSLDLFGRHLALRVHGYGLMLALGFLVAIYLARWRARRAGEDADIILRCGLLALVGGIVGGRIAYIIQHWSTQFAEARDPLLAMLNVSSGGLIYHGGLILATAMVIGYLVMKRLPLRRYLDIVAVSMMVGLAFGRAGCLLNGCCFGLPCRADWPGGMRFPMFSKPLISLTPGPGGFSADCLEPSPVYAHQLRTSRVWPDERLRDPLEPQRVWAPRYLHGRLTHDQLAELLDESRWAADFQALAGADGRISETEWQTGRGQGSGLLRGSENWARAVSGFDRGSDDQLDFTETQEYLASRRAGLLGRFDADRDGRLSDQERAAANAYLQEDLWALASAQWSAPVKPAQLLSMIGALVVAAILHGFYRLRWREGQVFALMAMVYPVIRFFEEALRDENLHDLSRGQLTHNQVTVLIMAVAGLAMWLGLRRLPPSAGPAAAQRRARVRNSRRGRTGAA